MSERLTEHGAFVVDRVYDASPDRVFAAWSHPQAKARWFDGPEAEFELDFRVGGWERRRGMPPDGREYTFEALYRDIVPGRRIVYTYDLLLDGVRISVSVAIAEFKPERDGTRLVFTEQATRPNARDTAPSTEVRVLLRETNSVHRLAVSVRSLDRYAIGKPRRSKSPMSRSRTGLGIAASSRVRAS